MKASGCLVAACDEAGSTRLTRLFAEPPLAFRATSEAVYVASSAAGPLGGDKTTIDINVLEGAHLNIRSVAATIALAGAGPSQSSLRISVAARGTLIYRPEPLVISSGAHHRVSVEVELATGAALELRDQVLFGRHGEVGGCWDSRLRVRIDGREVLANDQRVDATDDVDLGPYGTGGMRAIGTVLVIATNAGQGSVGDGWATMRLAGGVGLLSVAIAPDAPILARRLRAAQEPR